LRDGRRVPALPPLPLQQSDRKGGPSSLCRVSSDNALPYGRAAATIGNPTITKEELRH